MTPHECDETCKGEDHGAADATGTSATPPPDREPCKCGAIMLERWCGTYTMAGLSESIDHTRAACVTIPCAAPSAAPLDAPRLSTQHPTETIMDSRGHIHMYDDLAPTVAPSAERFRHTGFVTREPMPEKCDARRVLSALDKIAESWPGNEPVPESAAALAPLTPFERGYVLGVLAEYRAWLAIR